ncbi:MAG: cation transporter, partial [Candidatus Uhrbacteria bacterium]|nr:cation transporter [Candidatus Uhrbacteria bacterium]
MLKSQFNIEGMHCASCAVQIEGSLKKLPGVSNANVNYTLARASVEFDETKSQESDLHKVIVDSGYTVKMEEKHAGAKAHGSEHSGHSMAHTDAQTALRRAIISLV